MKMKRDSLDFCGSEVSMVSEKRELALFTVLDFAEAPKCTRYTEELLPVLCRYFNVTLFVSDRDFERLPPSASEDIAKRYFQETPVYVFHRAFLEKRRKPFSLFIHQYKQIQVNIKKIKSLIY